MMTSILEASFEHWLSLAGCKRFLIPKALQAIVDTLPLLKDVHPVNEALPPFCLY